MFHDVLLAEEKIFLHDVQATRTKMAALRELTISTSDMTLEWHQVRVHIVVAHSLFLTCFPGTQFHNFCTDMQQRLDSLAAVAKILIRKRNIFQEPATVVDVFNALLNDCKPYALCIEFGKHSQFSLQVYGTKSRPLGLVRYKIFSRTGIFLASLLF